MYKKAQSAMEYLMTYGWAILIILIAIAALFYLGVFSPSTPNNCRIQAPFNCIDIKSEVLPGGGDATLEFRIGVSAASNPIVTSITLNEVDCSSITINGVSNGVMNPNQLNIVSCTASVGGGDNFNKGDKFTGIISLSFTSQYGGLSHNVEGTFSGTMEEVYIS